MTDPILYRENECNISAPYLRGRKAVKTPRLEATTVSATHYEGLPVQDPDFNHTIYMGIERDVNYFEIGPGKCPELNNAVVCGIFEMITISDTTTGWYRGFVRGTSGQLSVGNLENVPINYQQKVWTLNFNTLTATLVDTVSYVQWKITIYNRS
jgi:hypothetical protein